MERTEIERQRKIGQQIMLIRLINEEQEKQALGLYSWIKKSDIATWMDEDIDTVEAIVSDCMQLSRFNAVNSAAISYCRSRRGIDIGYVVRVMYRYGILYTNLALENKKLDYEICRVSDLEEDYQGTDRSILSAEGFKDILDFYMENYINLARQISDKGYDDDVMDLMTEGVWRNAAAHNSSEGSADVTG